MFIKPHLYSLDCNVCDIFSLWLIVHYINSILAQFLYKYAYIAVLNKIQNPQKYKYLHALSVWLEETISYFFKSGLYTRGLPKDMRLEINTI